MAYAGAALVVVAVILLGAKYRGDLPALQRSLILGGIAATLVAGVLVIVRAKGGAWLLRYRFDPRPWLPTGMLVIAGAATIAADDALGSWISHASYPPPSYDMYNVTIAARAASPWRCWPSATACRLQSMNARSSPAGCVVPVP